MNQISKFLVKRNLRFLFQMLLSVLVMSVACTNSNKDTDKKNAESKSEEQFKLKNWTGRFAGISFNYPNCWILTETPISGHDNFDINAGEVALKSSNGLFGMIILEEVQMSLMTESTDPSILI